MPIAAWRFCDDRVDFSDSLTKREVEFLAADKSLRVLQCSKPVDAQTWELLNDELFARRPEVELRVYGFHTLVCDLAFASRMTNVQHFSADCLMDAVGVEHIAAMQHLESLRVGIYHLEGFGFLGQVTPQLKRLFLGATRSRKPDLSPLRRFDSLTELYLEGHEKNIGVLSHLESLQGVTLRSVSTPDISYLRPLHRMWSLDIKLGGITDLNAVAGMENIKYLELWQIRGLSDIGVISSLTGLQFLFLQALRQVAALPALHRLGRLRRICLQNMKGLEDVCSLEYAPALQEFIYADARNMQPEDLAPLLRNQSLKHAALHFGSAKRNRRFEELAREHNIDTSPGFAPFGFV